MPDPLKAIGTPADSGEYKQKQSPPIPVDSGSTTQWVTGTGTPDTLTSRGYREEQEHLAWLIRNGDPKHPEMQPRCSGRVALADAVVALCSNLAMKTKKRIEFDSKWFQWDAPDVPVVDGVEA